MRRDEATAAAVGLLLAVGLVAALFLREGGPTIAASRAAADVARVSCEPDGAVIDASVVRAGDAGVRFVVQNGSQAQFLRVRPQRELGSPVDIPLTGGAPSDAILAVAPGSVRVSCLLDRASGPAPASTLVIVDPQDLWISPEFSCPKVVEREFQSRFVGTEEDAVETVRRTIGDLVSEDEVAKPGYPQTRWHGDLVVVIRDGRTIGRVTRAQDQGMWTVALSACTGTGIVEP
ncbi:MAG: hypothetical protein WD965_00370 [Actinomycetota bacterium]